jgi:predicted nuclease of restriction endonuclease-like (RecB) superfamily
MNQTQKPQVAVFKQIRDIILQARHASYRQINTLKVVTNYMIGKTIVENTQSGSERAGYGKETLKAVSEKLSKEFGRGFSVDNLELMRSFYINYREKLKINSDLKSETLSRISGTYERSETISSTFSDKANLLKLSWSHFVLLLKMDKIERGFYELEAITNNWSIREFERQYNSSLYERLALSKNKEAVKQLSQNGQLLDSPSDLIKQPYILEFLGLREESAYSESDLERSIIDKIEQFLLELGKGFLFESRQKRISFQGQNFYVDLVFYNRLLSCYVLIELKIGQLTHQDIGQLQMYVNYFDRMVKTAKENPSIGIILCKQSNRAVVEFTLPEKEKQIFAREYKLYLPAKEDLKKQIENL